MEAGTRVYVLTSVALDDTMIWGVYSTPERAREAQDQLNVAGAIVLGEYSAVEEHEVDAWPRGEAG